jgi:surface protein
VDIADWDVSNVTHFRGMFSGTHNQGNMKLVPEVENWNMSSAVSIQDMFYGCAQIKNLDLSRWDVSNVTNMRHTFADCFGLQSVNVSTWNTANVQNFDGTFNDCTSLVDLDLSSWDTGSATTFAQMFEGCASLKTIKGIENWDVSNVTTAEEMFNSNSRGMSIEKLDLSGWNTASLKATWNMFLGCNHLSTIYVGDGWDMSKVTSSGSMFSDCNSLVGGNGTVFDASKTDKTYACVDAEGVPGYLTYKPAQNP